MTSAAEGRTATRAAPPVNMAGVARGSTANLIGAVVTSFGQLAITIVVTHALARADAGVFFSATSFFLLATAIGQLGSATGLVYFLSRCRSLGTPHLIAGYLRAALRPVIVLAISIMVLGLIFAPQLAHLVLPAHQDAVTTYLRILAVFVPFAGMENVYLAATRGLGTMKANSLVEQIGRPLFQLALVATAVTAGSTVLLGSAWALGYAPAAILAALWWRKLFRSLRTNPSGFTREMHRQFWKFTWPRAMSSVVQIAMQRFDIVLVAALSGAVNAAIYAAATRFVVVGQMGQNAINLAAQPRLAQAIAEKDHDGANHIYQTSTAWLILVTWPLYLVFIVFGPALLQIFGKGYGTGTSVLLLLSISMLVATGCGMVDIVLSMAGHTSWNLYNVVLAFGIQFGVDIWLIPHHGVMGAAIGWGSAIAVKNLVALSQIAIVMKLHPIARSTLTAAGVGVVAMAGIPLLARLAFGTSKLGLLVACVVGGLVYAALVWACRGVLQLDALRAVRRKGGGGQGGPGRAGGSGGAGGGPAGPAAPASPALPPQRTSPDSPAAITGAPVTRRESTGESRASSPPTGRRAKPPGRHLPKPDGVSGAQLGETSPVTPATRASARRTKKSHTAIFRTVRIFRSARTPGGHRA